GGGYFTAEPPGVLLQPLKDQLRLGALRRNVGNDDLQQPRGVRRWLDRRNVEASQQVVGRIAGEHPVQRHGNLSTQLPGLAALLLSTAAILTVVARILAITVADLGEVLT